ncbi:hypothetical protein A4U61_08425 [Streptomyces sp. H-KF8]|nr:hypothetical protein A4U61_08425 [Streptomyces sp. H-KF8]
MGDAAVAELPAGWRSFSGISRTWRFAAGALLGDPAQQFPVRRPDSAERVAGTAAGKQDSTVRVSMLTRSSSCSRRWIWPRVSQQKPSRTSTGPVASTMRLRLRLRWNHAPCSDWRTSASTRWRAVSRKWSR